MVGRRPVDAERIRDSIKAWLVLVPSWGWRGRVRTEPSRSRRPSRRSTQVMDGRHLPHRVAGGAVEEVRTVFAPGPKLSPTLQSALPD